MMSAYKKVIGIIFFIILSVLMYFNQKNIIAFQQIPKDLEYFQDKTIPPTLALTTIALGPIKGMIVDALWWRVIEQQDIGNFFEIIQLTDWITVLQPKNPYVWAFNAWNLSYNVAYEFPDPESRWEWIYKGISLLRDEGLIYNPKNAYIKNELAMIFFDRLAKQTDPDHEIFKKKWASIMMKYMRYGDRKELEELADAPDNPEKLKNIPEVGSLLKEMGKLNLNLLDDKLFYNHQSWSEKQKEPAKNKTFRKALEILDCYHRACGLRKELKLLPSHMLFVDRQYGPLDWRLPQAHVIYWAAQKSFHDYSVAGLNYQPIIKQAMEDSFRHGKLIINEKKGIFTTTNNFAIAEKIHDYYNYLLEHSFSRKIYEQHKNFLEEAISVFYTCNRPKDAEKLFQHYKGECLKNKPADFEGFLVQNAFRILHNQTYDNQQSLIEAVLLEAYIRLANGDIQRALGYGNLAKLIWIKHQEKYMNVPESGLPAFEDMKKVALMKAINNLNAESKKRLFSLATGNYLESDNAAKDIFLWEKNGDIPASPKNNGIKEDF